MAKPSYQELQRRVEELEKMVNIRISPQDLYFETKDLIFFQGYKDWSVDFFDRKVEDLTGYKLEDFLEGVELIFSKFQDVLQKKGVKEIEAAEGQPFNPEIHEAMTQIETNDVEEGAIVLVFQKGYYLHDRVIRASKVGVAKKKE